MPDQCALLLVRLWRIAHIDQSIGHCAPYVWQALHVSFQQMRRLSPVSALVENGIPAEDPIFLPADVGILAVEGQRQTRGGRIHVVVENGATEPKLRTEQHTPTETWHASDLCEN